MKINPASFYNDPSVADNYMSRRFFGEGGSFVNNVELNLILSFLPKNMKGKVVLDLGAGTGRLTLKVLERNPKQIFAVDPSRQMLSNLSKVRNSTLRLILGKAERIPLKKAQCDIVLSLRLFEHLEEKSIVKSLNEIKRILRPKGYLIINTVNRFSLEGLLFKIFGYSSSLVFPISNSEIGGMVKNAGFNSFKINEYAFIIPRGVFMRAPSPIVKILIFFEKLLIKTPLRIFAGHIVWYLCKS